VESIAPKLRAFIAIEVPDDIRAELGVLARGLRPRLPKLAWTPPENLHLTVRFLGNIPSHAVPRLLDRLRTSLAPIPSFLLQIAGLGAFPDLRYPSIIWAGVAPPIAPLIRTREAVESAAVAIGCDPESRPYHPHITLGRIRRPRPGPWNTILGPLSDRPIGGFPVSAVSLFSSVTAPTGAQHTRIARVPLASDGIPNTHRP